MTLLKGSSSQDARAPNWPGLNQQVRFATMANESYADRDRLFEIVRDGSHAEAKKVLSEADMSWRHTALGQNFLFFIAARRRRGSELLAKQFVAMACTLCSQTLKPMRRSRRSSGRETSSRRASSLHWSPNRRTLLWRWFSSRVPTVQHL